MPLMIGIQRPTDAIERENDVLSFFDGLFFTDDYIEHNSSDAKFGYSIFEQMDYIVFREENSIDFYASVKSLYLQERKKQIANADEITETFDDSDWEEIETQ